MEKLDKRTVDKVMKEVNATYNAKSQPFLNEALNVATEAAFKKMIEEDNITV